MNFLTVVVYSGMPSDNLNKEIISIALRSYDTLGYLLQENTTHLSFYSEEAYSSILLASRLKNNLYGSFPRNLVVQITKVSCPCIVCELRHIIQAQSILLDS